MWKGRAKTHTQISAAMKRRFRNLPGLSVLHACIKSSRQERFLWYQLLLANTSDNNPGGDETNNPSLPFMALLNKLYAPEVKP
jgi:hypothetical protein